uniref:Uncharacterized protein n=1 Tax=uncultured bacterium P1N3 TaxID=1748283 RepID=A0A0U3JH49_9BACT|nr:hypothetical protein [uncultured bacterium P1N3]
MVLVASATAIMRATYSQAMTTRCIGEVFRKV